MTWAGRLVGIFIDGVGCPWEAAIQKLHNRLYQTMT